MYRIPHIFEHDYGNCSNVSQLSISRILLKPLTPSSPLFFRVNAYGPRMFFIFSGVVRTRSSWNLKMSKTKLDGLKLGIEISYSDDKHTYMVKLLFFRYGVIVGRHDGVAWRAPKAMHAWLTCVSYWITNAACWLRFDKTKGTQNNAPVTGNPHSPSLTPGRHGALDSWREKRKEKNPP